MSAHIGGANSATANNNGHQQSSLCCLFKMRLGHPTSGTAALLRIIEPSVGEPNYEGTFGFPKKTVKGLL